MGPASERLLRKWLNGIRDRAQTALDGTGARPWSPEYVLEIVRDIRDLAEDAMKLTSEEPDEANG